MAPAIPLLPHGSISFATGAYRSRSPGIWHSSLDRAACILPSAERSRSWPSFRWCSFAAANGRASRCEDRLRSHVLYVRVRAQARIISEVPAGMVRVIVDHDLISRPVPIGDDG